VNKPSAIYKGRFAVECTQAFDTFISALKNNEPIQPVLESIGDALYIKSPDGQIIYSNQIYVNVFGGGSSVIGRFGEDFLTATIVPVSRASDDLITQGCTLAEFEHPGIDSQGRHVLFRTFKQSLREAKRPELGVFGITRIIEVRAEGPKNAGPTLTQQWQCFQSLTQEEQTVAIQSVHGHRVSDIASGLNVSTKTVDNRRSTVLKKMKLENLLDLTKLMVRLQDNGYVEFGL